MIQCTEGLCHFMNHRKRICKLTIVRIICHFSIHMQIEDFLFVTASEKSIAWEMDAAFMGSVSISRGWFSLEAKI